MNPTCTRKHWKDLKRVRRMVLRNLSGNGSSLMNSNLGAALAMLAIRPVNGNETLDEVTVKVIGYADAMQQLWLLILVLMTVWYFTGKFECGFSRKSGIGGEMAWIGQCEKGTTNCKRQAKHS